MTDWRRIDIDAFDPESGRLTEDDLKPPYGPQPSAQDIQAKIAKISTAANTGDFLNGIKLAMSEPPYGSDDETKYQYLLSVLKLLSQVRQAEIAGIVKQLERKEQDVLIKYLYKGMSVPAGQKQAGILLSWFEKITAQSGINPITRYISDRNTV